MSQAALDAANKEYMAALDAQPKDEKRCLELARKCLDIAKGSRLEARFKGLVAMHERRLAAAAAE